MKEDQIWYDSWRYWENYGGSGQASDNPLRIRCIGDGRVRGEDAKGSDGIDEKDDRGELTDVEI